MHSCGIVYVNEPFLVLDALLANSFAAGLSRILLYTDEATPTYSFEFNEQQ